MMIKRSIFGLPLVTLTIAGYAFANEQHAHVHGVAKLQIAIDVQTVQVDFNTPLENVLGFEHAPRSEKQKQAVQSMQEKFMKPATLFAFSPAAQCSPIGSPTITAPVLKLGTSSQSTTSKENNHADIEAEFIFHCRVPAELKEVEVKLFEAFPNLRRIDAQAASLHRQAAAKLSGKQRKFSW